ncbi:MAG: hypothetical protein V5804_09540 [Mucilaginibacter sp.]|uniref:hypothetical protein n=1 Tax=Mucilaginibacter sp. TaxID=1882438 RepID=UPI0034E6142B
MTKTLITCGHHPSVYFLEKWLPPASFIYGDASFTAQISVSQQLLLPKVSQPDFIHQLLNICLDNQIESVFAMAAAEQELLAEAVELFEEFNIKLNLPDLISKKHLLKEASLLESLQEAGIQTVPFQTSDSAETFSKACLILGYPTETLAISSAENPGLLWLMDDHLAKTKTAFQGKPVIPFIKAMKLFPNEMLLLRKFHQPTFKTCYAVFTDKKLVSAWNASADEEKLLNQVSEQLNLNGIFEFNFQEKQHLFGLKPFSVI